jgi:uncharacterized protein YicC (UPF0701 family)
MIDLTERFSKLKEKHKILSDNLIRAKERLSSEESSREELVKEIRESGYDPENLEEIKNEKEKELKELLNSLETSLNDIEEKLSKITNIVRR